MKEIELSKKGKKNRGKYKAIVDDDIFDEVNRYNWSYSNAGYAVRYDFSTGEQKAILLHRYIYELKYGKIPKGLEVEHKDQNGLNCQIINLRLATHKENMRNRSKRKNNTSGYIGVSKDVGKKKNKNGTIWEKEYWCCQWQDNLGKSRQKSFPYDNVGKVRAARYYDIMTSQFAGDYLGELNFQSLEEYQHELKKAILNDIKNNS
jgi:hypothetical protein